MSKGPISFSIKAKETKKPKIEYRTSVIYKQSCEQGESDEEVTGNEEGSEAECKEKSEANGKKPEQETAVNSGSTSTENSAPEVDSIKAAERIGMKDCFIFFCAALKAPNTNLSAYKFSRLTSIHSLKDLDKDCIKDQHIFLLKIILSFLITSSLDKVLTLLGED